MIKFLIFTLLCISCTKAIESNQRQVDLYKVVIDKYSVDTTILQNRITWWYDTVQYRQDIRQLLDTTKDIWSYHCPDLTKPAWVEHNYITRNGVKVQASKYPKN